MNITKKQIHEMMGKILNSRKYRGVGLNPTTIENLIYQEAEKYSSKNALLKSVRRKLHNIVAPYLGEPDYTALSARMKGIKETSIEAPEIRSFCKDVLSQHASTAERIPVMPDFYQQLFQDLNQNGIILDLACGLHPFAFPWMGLPITTTYIAYDIIEPRIALINQFFSKIGLQPLAENRDIMVNPPQIHADLALFLKEAHRFEKRKRGCNRKFWESIKADILAVSLPAQNLTRSHSQVDGHRNLVYENLAENQPVREIIIANEIIFLIENPGLSSNE